MIKYSKVQKLNIVLILLFCAVPAFASNPEVTVSQSFVSPRLNLFNDTSVNQYKLSSLDETVHFLTDVDYFQSIGAVYKIISRMSYGSPNFRYADEFQFHNLYVQADHNRHHAKLGRINLWNSLVNEKIDGLEYVYGNKISALSFAGGYVPVYNNIEEDRAFFKTSWENHFNSMKISGHLWGDLYDSETRDNSIKAGFIFNKKIKNDVRINGQLSWNLSEVAVHYNRINISKKYNKHKIIFSFRQRNFDLKSIYPFINKSLHVSPSATFSVIGNINDRLNVQHKVGYRFTEETNYYYSGLLSYRTLQFSLLVGNQKENLFYGGSLAGTRNLTDHISFGGSLSFNTIDYVEDINIQDSVGAYAWLAWKPYPYLFVKVFGRFYQNRYFNEDGRGGFYVSYTF